jgi:hypothetical protein
LKKEGGYYTLLTKEQINNIPAPLAFDLTTLPPDCLFVCSLFVDGRIKSAV